MKKFLISPITLWELRNGTKFREWYLTMRAWSPLILYVVIMVLFAIAGIK